MYERYCIIFFLFLFLLSGCSSLNITTRKEKPRKIEVITSIEHDKDYQKAVYCPLNKRIYAMDDNNNIEIFFKNKRIAKLGGIGTNNANFDRLTDIDLTLENKLLALDSFASEFKLFDSNGNLLSTKKLNNYKTPKYFSINRDNTICIFDSSKRNFNFIDNFSMELLFSFGKMEIPLVSDLSITKKNINIYNKDSKQTYIYNSLGRFDKKIKGYCKYDQYNNLFYLNKNYLEIDKDRYCFTVTEWRYFSIHNRHIILLSSKEIRVCKIIYESTINE